MELKNFDQLVSTVKGMDAKRVVAVAAAADAHVIESVLEAKNEGIAQPILVGDGEKIREILNKLGETAEFPLVEEKDPVLCARKAVELVRQGKADFLMKGILGTADLMRAVVDKEQGLRKGSLLSHVMVYEVPGFSRLLYLTDGGMNTYPDLEQKAQILENAAQVCHAMGMEKINAACVCGAEVVNPKIQATVDADALAQDTCLLYTSRCV